MNRRLLTIIAAVVLTLLGTWIIVIYVSSAEQRAAGNQELTNVLVPIEEIPADTPADQMQDLVEVRSVPADLRPEDAITELADVEGRVTDANLLPGEPLRAGRFVEPGEAGPGGRATVDEGDQIVTVSLEAQRALGGELRAGTRVGVLVSMDGAEVPDDEATATTDDTDTADASTGFVLNDIPVVAVSGGGGEGGGGGGLTISLSVDQNEAARIVFGAEHGRIWLTEQNDQTVTSGGSIRTRDNVYRGTGN
ncbi:MAG TPA: RcpC/CpaB family pilus assembly protein [Euzebyales bacterium]|nr:RcpC/CpaB family pilus assembly protein [Euzebyales bacterium]